MKLLAGEISERTWVGNVNNKKKVILDFFAVLAFFFLLQVNSNGDDDGDLPDVYLLGREPFDIISSSGQPFDTTASNRAAGIEGFARRHK